MGQRDATAGSSRLLRIAGRWTTSGFVIGDPAVPIIGTDYYDVLAGGRFLIHHVDVTVGSHQVRAIEIIGETNPVGEGYLARSYDNEGNAEVMHVTVNDAGAFQATSGPDIATAAHRSAPGQPECDRP
jgi:hypothetical protein